MADDILRSAAKVSSHQVNRLSQDILSAAPPTYVYCCDHPLFRIIQKDRLTIGNLYHHVKAGQLGNETVKALKRIEN